MWDDLLVNGTALSTFGGIVNFTGIKAGAPLRGSNLTIPGVAGDVHVPKVRGAYTFTVPIVLLGSTPADYNDRVEDLLTLLDSATAPLDLERRLTTGAGNAAWTAEGDYQSGLEPTSISRITGRVVLELINLTGGWTPVP